MATSTGANFVQHYMAMYNANNLQGIMALFAEDATMEDPAGGEVYRGLEAISGLYRAGFAMGVKISLEGQVRSVANGVAFPVFAQGNGFDLHVIDIFEFSAGQKIQRMLAFWGPDNLAGSMTLPGADTHE